MLLVHHAAKFGMVTGPTAIDMGRVRQRKRDMVDGLITMHLEKYKASGAELIMGAGRFVAPKTLEVRLNDGCWLLSRSAADHLLREGRV